VAKEVFVSVLFIVLPEKGHINPYIGPAQALQEQGILVAFASPGDISVQLNSAGLEFYSDLIGPTPKLPMRGKELVELVNDDKAMGEWVKRLLLDVSALEKIRLLIKRISPQVIVLDPLFYAAVMAVEESGIPWVSMSNSLNPILEDDVRSPLLNTIAAIAEERERLFRGRGMNIQFRGCDALSPHLTLAFCTSEFVGERSGVQLVGPSLPLFQRGDETALGINSQKKLIYVSFGSQIYHWPELFERLAEATADMDIHVIMSTGDLAQSLRLPEHVTLCDYAPQLDLLPRTDLFITHGGANSVMEAIALGTKRLWVSPMCNDQFHQAHYVQKSGIGISADLRTLGTDEIREKISGLLENATMESKMEKISSSYQKNGAIEAARLIRELL
jgi:zeaxanthin glucosyltransferase